MAPPPARAVGTNAFLYALKFFRLFQTRNAYVNDDRFKLR